MTTHRDLTEQQAALVRQVVHSRFPVRAMIVSPPGFGKSTVSYEIAAQLLDVAPDTSVLFIVPYALQGAAVAGLRDTVSGDRAPSSLTKRALREVIEERSGPITNGNPVVVAAAMLRQDEVIEWLNQARWDLIVVDEAHGLSGAQQNGLALLADASPAAHLLLLAATPPNRDPLPDLDWVIWTRDLQAMPTRRRALLVRYPLTPAERKISEAVTELAPLLEKTQASVLLDRAASSLFALESTVSRFAQAERESLSGPAGHALVELAEALASLREDSKLTACESVVERVREAGKSAVVFTSHRDSARFVYDALTDELSDVWLFAGDHTAAQLAADSARFATGGGVAVMTDAAIGMELGRIDLDGVAFDLPGNRTRWDRRWTHIDRVGRLSEARMHVLLPDPALDVELAGLRLVEAEIEPEG